MAKTKQRWMFAGATAVVALALSLPPSLAAIAELSSYDMQGRADSIPGRFTPAIGDSRLIARYAELPEEVKRKFSFTPALHPDSQANQRRAVTVVVRARQDSLSSFGGVGLNAPLGSQARIISPQQPAVVPVAFNLGAAIGYQKFVTAPTANRGDSPTIGAPAMSSNVSALERDGYDIRNLPTAKLPEKAGSNKPSRFVSRVTPVPTESANTAAAAVQGQSFDLSGSYRVTRNLELTAGVRYSPDENRLRPLSDSRRDNQAVYIGTQFRF